MAAEVQVELDRLAVLVQQKLITEEEFNAAKARLMPAKTIDDPFQVQILSLGSLPSRNDETM
jgi:hypothetical protein